MWHQGYGQFHQAQSHAPLGLLNSERQLVGEMRSLLRRVAIIDSKNHAQFGKAQWVDALPEDIQRCVSRFELFGKSNVDLMAEAAGNCG
jgi:hypothetical protein